MDYIYKVMTQPELDLAPPSATTGVRKPRPQILPHARPGGVAGLLELLNDRKGEEDMYHIAEELLLEVDDLLPIIDAGVLLGFVTVREGDVVLTEQGKTIRRSGYPLAQNPIPRSGVGSRRFPPADEDHS